MKQFKDLPIGIDLGTTFSCIGVYRNAAVEIIPNEKGDRTTPSVVSFLDDDIYVGEQTEYKRLKNPKNKIYAVKRIIGRNFDDKEVQEDINKFSYTVKNNNGRPQIEVDSNGIKICSPEEISAKVLVKLKESAESFLQQKIKKVVITVPAYFTERKKQATKNAGEIAGLDVIKIINEPTAASLAYGFGKCQNNNDNILGKSIILNNKSYENTFRSYNYNENDQYKDNETQKILVFDLGGGTLDVTLLELEIDDITVKGHKGIMHLGGEDFDNILLQYCIEEFKKKTKIDLNKEEYLRQKFRLKEHCEKAKRELSYINETEIEYESIVNGNDLFIKLTRAKFEDLCKDIFNKCKEPILELLKDSKEDKKNIDKIVLVGGSTRIPKIQSIIQELFDGKEINKKLNPDEAVAYGATIEAAMEMGEYSEYITLLDVCPFSLGIAIEEKEYYKEFGLLMDKIINKGSKLPCKKVKNYIPVEDFQKSVTIQVFEGENKFIKDNYPLGNFELIDLPYKKKNDIHIEITFNLNENSILTVTGIVKENNCTNSIVIKNNKGGLSRDEIENAKLKLENEEYGKDLGSIIALERNTKYEMNELIKKINNSSIKEEQLKLLNDLNNIIEQFLELFKEKMEDNDMYLEKIHFYLNYLFNSYSLILDFNSDFIDEEEQDKIVTKIKKYLKIFEKRGTSYCSSLIEIFYKNNDNIFGELCIQILGYYSQRGTELYFDNNKKYAKHFLEEALQINEKLSVEQRVRNNSELLTILDNCKELINIMKAESIDNYCKSFSKYNLIKEDEFKTDEEKIDILDRFKEALKYLKDPKKRADKLLKSIFLANIIKIEYKMFQSNNYDYLLKMIEECIQLKMQVPENCDSTDLAWFDEICKYKINIEEKQKKARDNPNEEENIIKESLINELKNIEDKFKEGKKNFLFYILKNHKPNGLDDSFIFNDINDFEVKYNEQGTRFIKTMRKLYHPQHYRGFRIEERKIHYIMREISAKLNSLDS